MNGENRKDIIASIIVVVLGMYVTYESTTMKGFGEDVTSPGVLPVVLGVLFIIFGIALLFSTINKVRLAETDEKTEDRFFSFTVIKNWLGKKGTRRIFLITILYFIYICLIIPYDFRWVSILFLLACFAVLKNISVWLAVVIAIFYPLFLQYFFRTVFRIILP